MHESQQPVTRLITYYIRQGWGGDGLQNHDSVMPNKAKLPQQHELVEA